MKAQRERASEADRKTAYGRGEEYGVYLSMRAFRSAGLFARA